MKIVIVDENDNEIDAKDQSEIQSRDIYRVSALWVTNSRNQVLLAQRKLTKQNDPGKWGPAVAGTVEKDETYESNIYKEVEEEIGLTGLKFKLGPKVFSDGEHRFFGQWFTCQLNKPPSYFKIRKDEVEKLAWFDTDFVQRDIKQNPNKYVENAGPNWQKLFA